MKRVSRTSFMALLERAERAETYRNAQGLELVTLRAELLRSDERLRVTIERCRVTEKRLRAAEERLQRVINAGHNDDCLFCAFKDKAAGLELKS